MRQCKILSIPWFAMLIALTTQAQEDDKWLNQFGGKPEFGITSIAPFCQSTDPVECAKTEFVAAGVEVASYNDAGDLEFNLLRFWRDGQWNTAGPVGDFFQFIGEDINVVAAYNRDICIGGDFTGLGPDNYANFACWSTQGEFWYQPGGSGPNGAVNDIIWDGFYLYVGGDFTEVQDNQGNPMSAKGIVSTTGFNWEPLYSLGEIDNGVAGGVSHIKLAGGFVYVAHGNSVSRWNRTIPEWGLQGTGNAFIRDMGFFGQELVVSGDFSTFSGLPAPGIAKAVPGETPQWETFDDGSLGPGLGFLPLQMAFGFLHVAGSWPGLADVNELARWTGQGWVASDTESLGGFFQALDLIQAGNGDLCIHHQGLSGAEVRSSDVVCQSDVDAPWKGVSHGTGGTTQGTSAIGEYQGDIIAAGPFTYAGDQAAAQKIARWDGREWHAIGGGIGATFGSGNPLAVRVSTVETFEGNLFAAGVFDLADGQPVVNLASWNGTQWSDVGGGIFGNPQTMLSHDGMLYIGGTGLSNPVCTGAICAWNGSAFETVGSGITVFGSLVADLDIYQGQLVAAGSFSNAGGVSASSLAAWDGTQWQDIGGGVSFGEIQSVAVQGDNLYVGGNFSQVGSPAMAVNGVARWDGGQWHALGSGIEGGVFQDIEALQVVGSSLYATGNFDTAGGLPANSIAKWTGTSWTPLEQGLINIEVVDPSLGQGNALHLANDGNLYVGGAFEFAGTSHAENIAVLDVNTVFSDGFEGNSVAPIR